MKYKVRGGSGPNPSVAFRCDQCHDTLVASLEEAGQATKCPSCGAMIDVPGSRERVEWKRARDDAERDARTRQAKREAQQARKQEQKTSQTRPPQTPETQRVDPPTGSMRSFSDRVLIAAFGFFRAISVLLVCVAVATIAIGLAWLAISLPSRAVPEQPGEIARVPDAAGFHAYCKQQEREAEQGSRSRDGSSSSDVMSNSSVTGASRFLPPCSYVEDDILKVVAALDLEPSGAAADYLCEWYTDIAPTDRERSWNGLMNLIPTVEERQRQAGGSLPGWCSGDDALTWYIYTDMQYRDEADWVREARLQDNAAKATYRQWSIDTAVKVIVFAIAILMAFIVLPLLIQIERNTRTGNAASREPR